MLFEYKGLQVESLLRSQVGNGPIISTLRTRSPRVLLPEVNTHRAISKNGRSSRAVTTEKLLLEVKNDPFVPWHWGKNQRGMQASEECNELIELWGSDEDFPLRLTREKAWLAARDSAVHVAEGFATAHYHKQVANRLLEPFMWMDSVWTATDWANFLHLRDHKDAEPHFQDLARLVREALTHAPIQQLEIGDWHIPYVMAEEWNRFSINDLLKLSAARCARVSYAPFDGNASIEREFERFEQLVGSDPKHASPVEHQAQADAQDDNGKWFAPRLHGNFTGWRQYRKMIPGEYVPG